MGTGVLGVVIVFPPAFREGTFPVRTAQPLPSSSLLLFVPLGGLSPRQSNPSAFGGEETSLIGGDRLWAQKHTFKLCWVGTASGPFRENNFLKSGVFAKILKGV